MEKKRYPILEEEDHAGMACEPSVGTTAAFSTYDAGSAPYDDDIASDDEQDDIDWDRLPSLGPFSEEEAIARIDRFEERLAKGEVKWISSEDAWKQLHEKYPWLR